MQGGKQKQQQQQKINQASLVQKAKGGRGMPGSDVCDYSHLLALDYQHREEQSCNVKSCSGQQQSVVSHAAGSKTIVIHLISMDIQAKF